MTRNNPPDTWTPLQLAYWRTVHQFRDPRTGRRGAAALAPKLGKSAATLSNEVNADMPSHKAGLEDSVTLQAVTGDYRVLQTYAAELGHLAVPLPDFDRSAVSDVALLGQMTAWQAAMGRTMQQIHDALADGDVDADEAEGIRYHLFAHMTEGLRFLHRILVLAGVAPAGVDPALEVQP